MGYTTLQIARGFVRAGSGDCSKDELTKTVNLIRRNFYNWYQEAQLFMDVVESYCVQEFSSEPDGGDRFFGVTLPREVAQVESMWVNDFPVMLRSSWREWQQGITPQCDCGLQKLDLPGYFSTAVDLTPGQPKRVRVLCQNASDVGKSISIRGMTAAGAPYAQDFRLSLEPQETADALRYVNRQGGVVKDVTAGRVVLADQDGRVLGQYEPDETVPSYRRVKIAGLRYGCDVVNIRASRRYFPVFGDNDVVETDNEPAWDAMARYLRLNRQADKSGENLAIEKDHLRTAKMHILGDKSREAGKNTRAEIKVVVAGQMPIRSRLNR